MTIKCPICGGKFFMSPKRKDGAANVFHATVGEWCKQMGDGFEKTKLRWKYYFGVWVPFPFEGDPPEWPGKHVTIDKGFPTERQIFMKSTTAYSKAEMRELQTGAEAECLDATVDLSILVEYEERKKRDEEERRRYEQKRTKVG